MTRDVHIVAISARTPVGRTAETSAAAIRAGISRLTLHPFLIGPDGNNLRCGRDASLEPAVLGVARIEGLAAAALAEITLKLTIQRALDQPLDVRLALPEPRPGFGVSAKQTILTELAGRSYPGAGTLSVQAEGVGHAGALYALAVAVRAVASGDAELRVIGGADSYLEAETLDWLSRERRLDCEGMRGGFPPGEAASFVALASEAGRKRLGLRSLGRIVGSSIANDERSWDDDEGLLGEGLTEAIQQAASAAGPPIGDIFCDVNGERLRADDWGLAILRTHQLFRDASAYTTCVAECGDVGAASGALGCVLAVRAWRRSYARGLRAMVWGASWSGLRAACVLDRQAPADDDWCFGDGKREA